MKRKPLKGPEYRLIERMRKVCAGRMWLIGLSLVSTAISGAALGVERFNLVLHQGRVIDPESRLDAERDVGIRDGKIAALSEQRLHGRHEIAAKGLVIAPGFIDMHSHAQQLPAARMQAFDGVTTALELEAGVLPVTRYYDQVAREGRPINYGASVSWTAARYAIFHNLESGQVPDDLDKMINDGDWIDRVATDEQRARVNALVGHGLSQGALGVGVLLAYAPGSGHREYYEINRIAAGRNVPTFTHVRFGGAVEPNSSFEAYQEIIANAVATGARMHICHLNSTSGRAIGLAKEAISAAQRLGLAISVEAYPYSAASTVIGSPFLHGPGWQERLGGVRYEDFMLDGVPLDEARFNELQRTRPETVIVHYYLRPDLDPRDDALLDASVLYPGGAIASDSGSWLVDGKVIEGDVWPMPQNAFSHPRSAGTFSRLLRVYVREAHKLTLMQAIEKASLTPARILESAVPQMKTKGRIRIGADADLIVFDPRTVADRGTFQQPARTSTGMRYVIVTGTLVIDDGKLVRSARPGRAIRREAD